MHPINQKHYQLLEKWRHKMDLVGPGNIDVHFEDAINSVQKIPFRSSWADLGSGAGFPGIALAAQQEEAHIQMIESRQKRCSFLKTIIREANINNVQISNTRTENISRLFDGVISRAYKPPLEYLEDAARLLKPEGIAVLMLGSNPDITLPPNWTLMESHRYPVADHTRMLWILQYRRQS